MSGCQAESFTEFSDHKLVIAHTTFKLDREKAVLERQFMCPVASRYNALDFNKAQWTDIEAELGNIDWSPMEDLSKTSPDSALSWFHEKVLSVLDQHVPKRKIRSGKPKSKMTCHQLYLECHKGQYLDQYCSCSTSQA